MSRFLNRIQEKEENGCACDNEPTLRSCVVGSMCDFGAFLGGDMS